MANNGWKARDHEIARLRAQIQEMADQPIAREFALNLGNSIMTILATTPFDQWPDVAKIAFRHEANKAPNAAALYKQRLT